MGAVFSYHGLKDAIQLIREIKEFPKVKVLLTLRHLKLLKDYWLIRDWTVLGNCILHEKRMEKTYETS